uniref:NADH-ubiquinone oxidoreductase chain 3 n=1 Tax=Abacion magnum TaxID=118452 RepID=S4T027_ABAMA|nr:NADH dehydrogenase subunit 3 [Abacion magnum]AFR77016.1 NADH dehydrogenase subunit 3 [Abacion magnum]
MTLNVTLIATFSLLALLLILIAKTTSFKILNNRHKNSPFECGFDPKTQARYPFSIQFFLIALIFLIFDIEITLMLPIPIMSSHSNLMVFITMSSIFILILLLGLYYEWSKNALNWIL